MRRPIITDINFLRQKSEKEYDIAMQNAIIKDLEDSLDISKGIGLAGVQIGILKNMAIIRIGEQKLNLINAYIRYKEDKFRCIGEGCLSLPSLKVDTIRYNKIYIVNNGKDEEYTGILSIIIQHELAHCVGRTILDDKWRAK